jgi:hypothetical protein
LTCQRTRNVPGAKELLLPIKSKANTITWFNLSKNKIRSRLHWDNLGLLYPTKEQEIAYIT